MHYLPAFNIILQETMTADLARRGFDINPSTVYGFLVVLLLLIGMLLWRAYIKSQRDAQTEREKYFLKLEEIAKNSIQAIDKQATATEEHSRQLHENTAVLQNVKVLMEVLIKKQ